MDYSQGKMGRIFVARIDHEEDLLKALEDLAVKEKITSAFFFLLGAVSDAKLVKGPKEKSIPPETVWERFDDARELLGAGNIFRESGKPKIHLHAAAGSNSGLALGCFREQTRVFMVAEVVIFEVEGIEAGRVRDPVIGFSPIRFTR